jgi:xylan 1,4-beta-xylosidase
MNSKSSPLSRRTLLKLTAGVSAATLADRFAVARAQNPKPRNGAMFQNPLFGGDYADPSILRVGRDFYLTHTSYRYAPGLVVWHSRDLVNWLPISSALPYTFGEGEVWAPDLVEHQGHYFIYFPLNGKLTVVHAPDPRGPWSKPIDLGVGDIDPGHVVGPDGTRYLYSGGGHVIQLSADGLSTVGESKTVYQGWQFPKDWQTEGFWLESPKLTRRGDYYYLTCAQGGTAGPPTSHMAVVARSKSPLGPWENSPLNPLIHTYSPGESWWSVGHGTLVSTPDDRWYFVYHGYRNGFQSLGRHILLEPVEWTSDGWPRAPLGAYRDEPMPAPMGVAQRPMMELSDDFRSPHLKETWTAWSETDMSRFQTGQGALTIRAKGDSPGQSSPLTVKARDTSYVLQVEATPQNGCAAALGLFYSPRNWVFAEIKDGQLRLYDSKATLVERAWKAATVQLKIINRRNYVEFLASENGRDWESLLANYDATGFNTKMLGGFQALRPALAASGTGDAHFARFQYQSV